ncbi:hypothetical protein C0992_011522 [Termitomyces sp. T32_za158]|nr:hypothetical protein C0992_011522 [Termitomyces sp. T32_za158]
MSTEDVVPEAAPADDVAQPATKKRPRLDLGVGVGGRERKRGKSMFGLVVGTLTKAKIEDKERSASEAAKKRQLIEQRLQTKLRIETDSVRRAEEAKKDKMAANRKEEELQLKDSIYKFRRTRLPLYANFLLTSDLIVDVDDNDNADADADADTNTPARALANPPRTHPPPLYYLPAVLLPAQAAFLSRRKDLVCFPSLRMSLTRTLTHSLPQVNTASETEYALFRAERARGITDVNVLRQRVADEEARKRSEVTPGSGPSSGLEPGKAKGGAGADADADADAEGDADADAEGDADADADADAEMEVDGTGEAMDVDRQKERERGEKHVGEGEGEGEVEKKEEPAPGDEVDAVEY